MFDDFVTTPFTIRDGVLKLDSDHGKAEGPRVIDSVAGVVRFGDGVTTVPISDLRAVAVLWVEREIWVSGQSSGHYESAMVHVIVLVPRAISEQLAELLERIAQQGEAADVSVLATANMVDEVSFSFLMGRRAIAARIVGKEIARLTRLPLIELYGEWPIYLRPEQLDQALRERLQSKSAPPPDPGPEPEEVEVERAAHTLTLRWMARRGIWERALWILAGITAALGLVTTIALGLGGIPVFVMAGVPVVLALRQRGLVPSRLVVDPQRIRWLHDGHETSLGLDELELVRIYERTLILITGRGEVRCNLPSEDAAIWARAAIVHHLVDPGAGPYR